MLIPYIIAFILVALIFNMANKNARGGKVGRNKKSHQEALKDWAKFEEEHPGSNRKNS